MFVLLFTFFHAMTIRLAQFFFMYQCVHNHFLFFLVLFVFIILILFVAFFSSRFLHCPSCPYTSRRCSAVVVED